MKTYMGYPSGLDDLNEVEMSKEVVLHRKLGDILQLLYKTDSLIKSVRNLSDEFRNVEKDIEKIIGLIEYKYNQSK